MVILPLAGPSGGPRIHAQAAPRPRPCFGVGLSQMHTEPAAVAFANRRSVYFFPAWILASEGDRPNCRLKAVAKFAALP